MFSCRLNKTQDCLIYDEKRMAHFVDRGSRLLVVCWRSDSKPKLSNNKKSSIHKRLLSTSSISNCKLFYLFYIQIFHARFYLYNVLDWRCSC